MFLYVSLSDGFAIGFSIAGLIIVGLIILCVLVVKKGVRTNYNWAVHQALEKIAFNQITEKLHYNAFANAKSAYVGWRDVGVINTEYLKPEVRVQIDQRIQELGDKYFMNAQPFLDYLYRNNILNDNGILILGNKNVTEFYNEVGQFLKWLYEGHTNQEQYIGQWDAKYISI